jgi:hypothetical protein
LINEERDIAFPPTLAIWFPRFLVSAASFLDVAVGIVRVPFSKCDAPTPPTLLLLLLSSSLLPQPSFQLPRSIAPFANSIANERLSSLSL